MEEKYKQLWEAVLGELELQLSKASFTTWLKNTFIMEIVEGRITVAVPNTFSQAWLKQKYHQEIYKILQSKIDERIKEISYKVQSVKSYQQEISNLKKLAKQAPKAEENTSFSAVNNNKPNDNTSLPHSINQKYLFDTFIVGKANELAHAAALAVGEKPGSAYNPLFIYGGVGLGKTHLMQSIGNLAKQKNPDTNVIYVTCEKFTNDFINAISSGKAESFNKIYRSADILLVDDIQFLTGKEGTQEAFFHTFNELHQKDKQIVITSDRPPKAISTLEDRLLSRFEWGMIADISQPDLETRIAILETKCLEKQFVLERDIIQYITLNIQNNIRELEGALNKIIAYHQLNKVQPTLENVKKILFSISNSSKGSSSVSPKSLIDIVIDFYDISMVDIMGKSREKRLSFPRQIIMYLLREELRCSYPMIGHELGGRDHTTAMHAYDKISRVIQEDEKTRQEINMIKQKVYSS